jgi:hypothetical protein
MGWVNYIVIEKLKLAIEISRSVEEISEWETKAIDYLTDEERYDDNEAGQVELSKINIDTLTNIYNTYSKASSMAGMYPDKFLLYWLDSRGIEYEVISEYTKNREALISEGYTIVDRDLS